MDERPNIFFPKIKFQRVKSVEKALDFDARTATFYWLQNRGTFEIPEVGVQAEYRDDFKIVSFCDFDFSHFPFETLICNVTFRLYDLSIVYNSFKSKPDIYFHFNNEKLEVIPIKTNLPFDITAEAIELFTENDSGMVYSATGVTFQLKRNSLGLLLSRFYGPMACFAFLSVLSYNINIDMVNMNIIFIDWEKRNGYSNLPFVFSIQVPGRMGMIITLCLISFNVYNAVDAPPSRGFSYIEVWMVGMEIPIIFALLEYSLILGFKRCTYQKLNFFGKVDEKAAQIDSISSLTTIIYISVFSLSYWALV